MNRPSAILVLGLILGPGTCHALAQTTAPPPRLGLTVEDRRFPDGTAGVVVMAIVPRSPASRAMSKTTGRPQPIKPGDMVVGFAGEVVDADGTFANRVAAASGRVELVVQSRADRQLHRLWVDLLPADEGRPIELSIGLRVRGGDRGIHIDAVEPGSPAADSIEGKTNLPVAIAAGSHLLSIDGQPVSTPAEAADRLSTAGPEIHFEIEQPRSPGKIDLPIVLCVIGRNPSAAATRASAP